MSNSSKQTVLEEVRIARDAVSTAERELDKAIAEISSAPRAMKMTVSVALQQIFTALRGARTKLSELEETIENSE
jgi:hypothetical protein